MRYIDILESFEREINKLDDTVNKPATDESLYWLNQAVAKFVKLRYNGDFIHRTGYEETEKRFHDLGHLLTYIEISDNDMEINDYDDYKEFELIYPNDVMYTLSESTLIEAGNIRKQVPVFECTADSFMYRINNSLTDFHYRNQYARPLRIRTNNGCKLLTDGKYYILSYKLQYLRQPNKITLDNPTDDYTEFEEIVMPEIIKIAAQMYIENKADKRYQTISNEINTQE